MWENSLIDQQNQMEKFKFPVQTSFVFADCENGQKNVQLSEKSHIAAW